MTYSNWKIEYLIKWKFTKIWPGCRETIRDGTVAWASHQVCYQCRVEGGGREILERVAAVCIGAFDSPATGSSLQEAARVMKTQLFSFPSLKVPHFGQT